MSAQPTLFGPDPGNDEVCVDVACSTVGPGHGPLPAGSAPAPAAVLTPVTTPAASAATATAAADLQAPAGRQVALPQQAAFSQQAPVPQQVAFSQQAPAPQQAATAARHAVGTYPLLTGMELPTWGCRTTEHLHIALDTTGVPHLVLTREGAELFLGNVRCSYTPSTTLDATLAQVIRDQPTIDPGHPGLWKFHFLQLMHRYPFMAFRRYDLENLSVALDAAIARSTPRDPALPCHDQDGDEIQYVNKPKGFRHQSASIPRTEDGRAKEHYWRTPSFSPAPGSRAVPADERSYIDSSVVLSPAEEFWFRAVQQLYSEYFDKAVSEWTEKGHRYPGDDGRGLCTQTVSANRAATNRWIFDEHGFPVMPTAERLAAKAVAWFGPAGADSLRAIAEAALPGSRSRFSKVRQGTRRLKKERSEALTVLLTHFLMAPLAEWNQARRRPADAPKGQAPVLRSRFVPLMSRGWVFCPSLSQMHEALVEHYTTAEIQRLVDAL